MPKYQSITKSEDVRHGTAAPRQPRSKKDEQEFGLAKKEYLVCPDCNSVYFDKAWHHSLAQDRKHFNNKPIKFKICPACRMKKDRVFEGELILKLGAQNRRLKTEILNTIKNSDKQAGERDPMDRILWMEEKNSEIHIYTSENQLAVRIGKKLKSAFKGSNLDISRGHAEDVIRVAWEYQKTP